MNWPISLKLDVLQQNLLRKNAEFRKEINNVRVMLQLDIVILGILSPVLISTILEKKKYV